MNRSQLKAGAILSYATVFLGTIISLVYTPFMLRLLGQSEYGLYSLSSSIIGYLGVMEFGFGNALVRYTAAYRALDDNDSQCKLYGMFLIIYSVISVAVIIAGTFVVMNSNVFLDKTLSAEELIKAKMIMSLMVFNLAISLPFSIFASVISAHERFIFSKTIQLLYTMLSPMIILLLLLMGYRSVGMAMVGTFFTILSIVVNAYYCFNVLKIKFYFKNLDWSIFKEIAAYSFYIFLGIIFDKIFWSSNQFILGMLSGTVAVAIYSIGASFNAYYMSLGGAITGMFLPKMTAMVTLHASNQEISTIFIRIGRILFIILSYFLSAFILFGQEFISFWAGKDYSSAYPIALVLMIPLTVGITQSLGISILQARNKQAFRNKVYIIIAVCNIVGSYFIAPLWGGFGCAVVSALVQLIGPIIIMNIYYYKVIYIDIPAFWREISKVTIPVLIALSIGALINLFINNGSIVLFIVSIVLFTIVFIPLMWTVALNENEKKMVLDIFAKYNKGKEVKS